ncbi:MAG TPA: AAA family ATPase, partial [Candidatus Acidoferrales bacterium]|nr:AAA family ATPase [Candidatus Acidoferrales bacterium]
MATATPFENQFRGTDFVGRHNELAELRAGLDRTTAGHTQIFLLGGEPGIGKTRIANEIASVADQYGMRVAWGICCEGAGAPAYWPMIQVARSLLARTDAPGLLTRAGPGASQIARLIGDYGPESVPAAGLPDEPEQARFRLFDGFASLLSAYAETRPLLVVLDDLQDADPTSWLMLRYIARELHDVPLMIAVAYRDVETRRQPIATQVISDLLRTGRQILLSGLSESEVAEMVEKSAGHAADRRFVAELHRTTGGNPFFVTEVVRTLAGNGALKRAARDESAAPIPESLRTSIRARLGALSARANSILAGAAALGSEFDLVALQRLTGAPLDEILRVLDLAGSAAIAVQVEEGRTRYRFVHSLIREVLHRDLDDATRMELHRKIVGVLEDLYRAEPDRHVDELAYHSMRSAQAGLADKAIDYSIRAGEAAYAAFAYEKSARHWREALTLMEEQSAEPLKLARLLERLSDALSITEVETPTGIDCLERALRLYESAGRTLEAAHAHAQLAVMLSTRAPSMNIQRALREYRNAEQVLGKAVESESQVWLYNGLAQAAMQAQHTAEEMAASRRGMEVAAHLGR